ncbi:MAG: hypothetical protein ACM686_18995 [Enterobacteriaceae bacterium]|jgi:hypothetical protein|nr:MAG TPA: G protein pathway suppressor 2, SMRT, TBL1, co-repressor, TRANSCRIPTION [Caudoviricetes sp.]
MTKDEIIRQIEDVRRQRAKTERQLIARGRGYPVHNDAEVELTLDEYHYEGSSSRSEERLLALLDEERAKYTTTLTYL